MRGDVGQHTRLRRYAQPAPNTFQSVGQSLHHLDAIVPALERMTGGAGEIEGPQSGRRVYLRALLALRLALQTEERELAPLEHAGGMA